MATVLEEAARRLDVKTMFYASIVTALAFVVGLFWNDAIRSVIELTLPIRDTIAAKFVAAIAVTIIVLVVAWILYHTQQLSIKYEKEMRTRLEKQLARYKKLALKRHRKRL